MIVKFAVLLFASACLAFPADEAPAPQAIPPQGPQGIPPPQDLPAPQGVPVPFPEGQQPEGQLQDAPLPPQGTAGGKPENSDLKTDSTFWFRKTYYPVVYRRSYYPRSYSYSYYPTYYSYWNPYYWW